MAACKLIAFTASLHQRQTPQHPACEDKNVVAENSRGDHKQLCAHSAGRFPAPCEWGEFTGSLHCDDYIGEKR